jgi:predicted DNA-binding transcriptional regulator AlpA
MQVHNYVTLPELGRLCGLSPQGMYNVMRRGTGPLTRPLGKQEVVPFGAAVSWAEDRRKWGKLTATRRRALEDGIRELRVRWVLHRAAERRRLQQSAQRRWNYPAAPVEAV